MHDDLENRDRQLFIDSLGGLRETDLIFKKGRLYIRRIDIGYLVVLMGSFVPIAMMRLQCDILLPSLKPAKATKGIRRFFKKYQPDGKSLILVKIFKDICYPADRCIER